MLVCFSAPVTGIHLLLELFRRVLSGIGFGHWDPILVGLIFGGKQQKSGSTSRWDGLLSHNLLIAFGLLLGEGSMEFGR